MKMKLLLSIFILSLLVIYSCNQTSTSNSLINLDFEKTENGMPKGWYRLYYQPNYTISIDSTNVKSGNYSVAIEYTGGFTNFQNNYQAIQIVLPKKYEGEKITLSGYIKTENVTDGHAGLWMQIDPQIAFDNMHQQGVAGTTDWEKYEITLEMDPENTQGIILGGVLSGKGKMWVDNLQISIDGENIEDIKLPDSELLFFGYNSSPAKKDNAFDNGSNLEFPELTGKKIDDLELLGKIWGLLKYHHPAIAGGKYNWDYELFRVLPVYLSADDNHQRDNILRRWINRYGRVPTCKTCQETPETAILKPDLSWIDESDLDQGVKDLLHDVYLNRHQGNQYYVRMDYPYARPIFVNENPYSGMDFPDDGFRLLALFRLWNMTNYFFPYKNLTDKDWSTVLKEYIPYFIDAKNRLEYELVSVRLIGELSDSHAILLEGHREISIFRGHRKAPVSVRFIENKLVVTDTRINSKISIEHRVNDPGLQIGDVIMRIEGKAEEAIVESVRNYYPAINEVARILGSFFVSKDTVYRRFTEGNPDNPGEFNLRGKFEIFKSEEYYPGKLVVIVNEKSQSRSEETAMAFRAGDNTTIIGSQTAGTDGHISEMTLPGGLKTWNSGIGVCYPDGTQTQRIGIVPDIWIEPTINGIKQGRDEVLEKAIEIIRKQ